MMGFRLICLWKDNDGGNGEGCEDVGVAQCKQAHVDADDDEVRWVQTDLRVQKKKGMMVVMVSAAKM